MKHLYVFLLIYAVERFSFALKVSKNTKIKDKAWMTLTPTLTYIVLCAIFFIEHFVLIREIYYVTVFGFILIILGVVFRYSAILTLQSQKQNWSSHIDADSINVLIQNGPYRITRHPYYLSVVLELCGVALLLNSLWSIILVFVVQVPFLWRRIVLEESKLIEKFGNNYLAYKNVVGVVLPPGLRRKSR